MRHENSERLLRLCLLMAGSHEGITISRIMGEFDVSRRTAERMRDAALRLLPEVTEATDETGVKRWKAPQAPRGFATITTQDIATLHSAADLLEGANRHDQADGLRSLTARLMSRQEGSWKRRMEPDLELLLESEGVAHRAGPVTRISLNVLHAIRDAILRSQLLRVTYSGRGTIIERQMDIEPYGLLYGARPYLVGRVPSKPDLRHFRVQGIRAAAVLKVPFERDLAFNLKNYRAELFGSFREPPFSCVWRFSSAVADDAAEYLFHPMQETEVAADGTFIVRFKAGGLLEMAWHLMTWGSSVEVVSPPDFWEQFKLRLSQMGRA